LDEYGHTPVLLDEILLALDPRPGGICIDCTYGRGGHSAAILARLGPGGRLLAFDRDPDAVAAARRRFGGDPRFEIHHGSFAEIGAVARARGIAGTVDGVLFDLGVSSPQLEGARGFGFRQEGPLDMRFDPASGEPAWAWLARAPAEEIADVLWRFGEERYARRIAAAIVRERAVHPITDARQLRDLIARAVPTRERGKDPATRSFQAIRIHINRELEELEAGLRAAVDVLRPGGRIAVISFHSLEDRIVKRYFRDLARGDPWPADLPVPADAMRPVLRLVGRAQRPSEAEVNANPRARSAVLRVAEKLAA
jgi:16S rRNA (cytosine1402-N4)-methyltransferase